MLPFFEERITLSIVDDDDVMNNRDRGPAPVAQRKKL
jgi:hypothetical protein